MSEQIKDGGPAFPVPDCGHGVPIYDGMSLRDYFAARVLQSLMMAPIDQFGVTGETRGQATTRISYEYADAMLAAREAQP